MYIRTYIRTYVHMYIRDCVIFLYFPSSVKLKVAMERKTKQLLQQLEQKQLENDEFKQQSEQLEQRNEEVNRKLRNLVS